jgi:hypothetical protein
MLGHRRAFWRGAWVVIVFGTLVTDEANVHVLTVAPSWTNASDNNLQTTHHFGAPSDDAIDEPPRKTLILEAHSIAVRYTVEKHLEVLLHETIIQCGTTSTLLSAVQKKNSLTFG